MTVVYNAIDTVQFSPGVGDGARLDELAGLPAASEGTIRVGLVATYARWKGQDLFIESDQPAPVCSSDTFLYRRGADLQDDGITVFGRGASGVGGRTGRGRSSGVHTVSGRDGRRVPGAGRRSSREYKSGAIWPDDRRSDGLQPPGHRVEHRRRGPNYSPTARMPWGSSPVIPMPWPRPSIASSKMTRSATR